MNYKLIKKLPFEKSPEIGYISKPWLLIEDKPHYWNSNWFNPKNYPEFWEEIVEKDYEILSYIGKSTKNVLSAKLDPFVNNKLIEWEDKNLDIHSVKRLSDGEIFTVGDKTDVGIIESIQFDDLKELGIKVSDLCGDWIYYSIGIIEKKQPLFTTEQRSEIEEIIKNIIK